MAKKSGKSASQRTAESRAAKLAKGWAQKNLLLAPDALADLAKLARRYPDLSETEIVSRSLAAYAQPETDPSDDELVSMLAHRLRLADRAGR